MSVGISLGVDRYKSKRRKGGGGQRREEEKEEEEKHTLKGRLGLELDGMISIKQSIKRSYNIR